MQLLNLLEKLWRFFNPDLRSKCEKASEREFILAANSLKTLSVTDRGGMSIDPEELREHIIASREQLKHLVHKPGTPGITLNVSADLKVAQETNDAVEANSPQQACHDFARHLPKSPNVNNGYKHK